MEDRVFANPKKIIESFSFNEEVASVFEDMLLRSIPNYRQNLVLQIELAAQYYQKKTNVYDLGASHGNFSFLLAEKLPKRSQIVAIDNSEALISQLQKRIESSAKNYSISQECKNLEEISINNASVVALNYTLQFLAPEKREALLSAIYKGLNKNGLFIFAEKIKHEVKELNDLEIEYYHHFKRKNGYSELEISQKREALENFLIPDSLEKHLERLKNVGFEKIELVSKWFNFIFIACWK